MGKIPKRFRHLYVYDYDYEYESMTMSMSMTMRHYQVPMVFFCTNFKIQDFLVTSGIPGQVLKSGTFPGNPGGLAAMAVPHALCWMALRGDSQTTHATILTLQIQ